MILALFDILAILLGGCNDIAIISTFLLVTDIWYKSFNIGGVKSVVKISVKWREDNTNQFTLVVLYTVGTQGLMKFMILFEFFGCIFFRVWHSII